MQADFLDYISQILGEQIISCSAMTGGDISEVYKLATASQELLLKTHRGKQAFAMLSAEKQGLETISKTKTIQTPKVYFLGEYKNTAFLVMEYVHIKNSNEKDFERLGLQLASLHQSTALEFGFPNDNFIGSLPQSNHKHTDWTTFYVKERLQIQLDLARSKGLLSSQDIPNVDSMLQVCNRYFQDIRPNLLHGDLWGGNFLIAENGVPYLIDPAVYYGHSEVDLAMSRLFGGFSSRFYDAYHSINPLGKDNQERNNLYQLYYLLVHLNLFGSSYYAGVKRILEKYFL